MRRLAIRLVLAVGWTAAAFAGDARDQRGQAIPLTPPFERTTVVDFAASWCTPCWKALPELEKLAKLHPELRFVVVSVDEKLAGRDLLVQRLELELPVVWDEGQALAKRFRPAGMPTTLVLDASGKEIYRHAGSTADTWKALVAFLDSLERKGAADAR